jgi:alpha-glucosidase
VDGSGEFVDRPSDRLRRPGAGSRSERSRREDCRGAAAGLRWWQQAIIYQIYPLSFQDSNGDGKGDLPGLLSRLDYLSSLGVTAVWLGPVYPSPMLDFGYDIADFTGVDPTFGTLDDLDRVIDGLHARGIKLILDFVPNHTSDRHPWFIDSRSSRNNPKRDWYVWCDPAPDGGPPNNWLSRFGGSAWEFDRQTGQYYYHAFLKQQPDLNWRNPEVRRAMADVLRFWMRRGVDGFRVDAAAVLAEDRYLRDEPPNPDFDADTPPPERFERKFTDSQAVTLNYLAELRAVTEEFPGDRVLLGEVDTSGDKLPGFYGDERHRRLHLPLNYGLGDSQWDESSLRRTIQTYLDRVPPHAWPDWVIGSHDKPRVASRVGSAQARVAAMLLFTLPGTPILYAGDEIGMENGTVPPARVRDPFERRLPGYGLDRDPYRVPMRWEGGERAGFTSGEPWLPISGGESGRCNVAAQSRDERSLLALYRRLIAFRSGEPMLSAGSYEPVRGERDVLAYWRRFADRRVFVALNLRGAPKDFAAPFADGTLRLSTHLDRQGERVHRILRLRPNEGIIVEAS